ncbi:hypothetical protein EYR41_004201 [Orbilia oligospora]|uniref:Protein kinase domain-containing protein n=1 Tax=Orbilia oligospora TaxID=2813651 RepID=A0A8H2E8A1_ORBOL|nr:hypothetical protein EYR41_004201 [Orbilia oligospora]
MRSELSNETELSWLQSKPPWSGNSDHFLPLASRQVLENNAKSVGKVPSIIEYFAKLIQTRSRYTIPEITFRNHDRRQEVAEGSMYRVWKYTASRPGTGDLPEVIAVKEAKLTIPSQIERSSHVSNVLTARLKSVLLEIEVLFYPPLANHKNIVKLLGISWDIEGNGLTPFLVMEFASFGSLNKLLLTEDVTDSERLSLCAGIADGLKSLHNYMIVHGDVKQDNILIFPADTDRFIAKISDFEHAFAYDDPSQYRGTSVYNAPEVHAQRNPDKTKSIPISDPAKCDIFSFGILVFEVLSKGVRYFHLPKGKAFHEASIAGDQECFMDLALQLLDERASLSESQTRICRQVFQITLQYDPGDRLVEGWPILLDLLNQSSRPEEQSVPLGPANTYQEQKTNRLSILELFRDTHMNEAYENSLIEELRYTAENAPLKADRARASLQISFICFSNIASSRVVDGEGTDWLIRAVQLGDECALAIGPRIFEAKKISVPEELQRLSDDKTSTNTSACLQQFPSPAFYRNAVRVFWGRNLRTDLEERFYDDRDVRVRKGEDYQVHRALCSSEGRTSLRSYLNHEISFNDQTEDGLTPLHIACMRGDAEQVYLLLSVGSDASINDKRNISPLHYLVLFPEKHIPAIAWALIRAGARINSQPKEEAGGFFDNLGMCLLGTPLQWAILCRNQLAMSVLLYLGASIFGDQPKNRLDCFFACVQTVCADTLEILLRESLTTQPLHGRDAYNLFFHVGSGHSRVPDFQRYCMHGKEWEEATAKVFGTFARYGFPIRERHKNKILISAARDNCPTLVRYMIDVGADVNAVDRFFLRPINALLLYGIERISDSSRTSQIIRLLVDNGASLEPYEISPMTPYDNYIDVRIAQKSILQLAMEFGSPFSTVELIARLTQRDINCLINGKAAIHCGQLSETQEERIRIASLLISLGADVNLETSHQYDSDDPSRGRHPYPRDTSCCKTAVCTALADENWPLARYYLENGGPVKYGISGGHCRTIVHFVLKIAADEPRRLQIFEGFLELILGHPRAKEHSLVDCKDFEGFSPLVWAAYFALPSCVRILLDHGADVHCESNGLSLGMLLQFYRENPPQFVRNVQRETKIKRGDVHPSVYLQRLDEISQLLS